MAFGYSSLFSKMWKWLQAVVDWLVPSKGKPVVAFLVMRWPDGTPVTPGENGMNLLREGQKVTAEVSFLSATGKPARVDGVPTWNNSDETVGRLEVHPSGMKVTFFALVAGVTQISMQADADLGAGVRPIIATADIQVEPGEAITAQIVFGVPENQ